MPGSQAQSPNIEEEVVRDMPVRGAKKTLVYEEWLTISSGFGRCWQDGDRSERRQQVRDTSVEMQRYVTCRRARIEGRSSKWKTSRITSGGKSKKRRLVGDRCFKGVSELVANEQEKG